MSEPRSKSEAPRDQSENPFTRILRRLRGVRPGVLAVCFVDQEGEAVDYCSSVSPYDAKVAGASMLSFLRNTSRAMARLASGEVSEVVVWGDHRELCIRRVASEYSLVVVLRAGAFDDVVRDEMDAAARAFRDEAQIPPPEWEGGAGSLQVTLRKATGWAYAPASFFRNGRHVAVSCVLGRWEEAGGVVGGALECFRVRTEDGAEMTLAHSLLLDRWWHWSD